MAKNTPNTEEGKCSPTCKGGLQLLRRTSAYVCPEHGNINQVDETSSQDWKGLYEDSQRRVLRLEQQARDAIQERATSTSGLHQQVRDLRARIANVRIIADRVRSA